MITKWGGFIDNYDAFDPAFFNISPREAQKMDPQQRWLLETSWEAFEDAGLVPQSLENRQVGVFVGISSHDYVDVQRNDLTGSDAHSGTGGAMSVSANRLSYFYDFQGPSVAVDTACSSSLTAVYLACQSIWTGDSNMALVGGTNNLLNPSVYVSFSKASMLSPDGRCFTFDHRANGYVRGEGVGVVIIKTLAEAQAHNDRIYAVIKSAAANQDGRSSSLTAPSQASQEEMLRAAYRDAGIDPFRVSYIEAHGTGTPVGDPIEARALGNVVGVGRQASCLIGSAKTNLGHLEAAAGMVGLIKGALVLHHQTIPAHLNFERPNPNIPLDELGLEVVCEITPLPKLDGKPPVVGVNSFGFGGANAHIVLQASPEQSFQEPKLSEATRPYVLGISAADEVSLKKQAVLYHQYLVKSGEIIGDVAASAGGRRSHLDLRLAVIGTDKNELCARLLDYLNGEDNDPSVVSGHAGRQYSNPVFVFTGQGSQWWGMGQGLLQREPCFRRTVEAVDALFQPLSGWSIIAELLADEELSRIDDTDVIQPAIFAVQLGLSALWAQWGIHPSKVVGHSVGEVAAAYIAGIYSLEDAVSIIYHRSRLQHTTAGQGGMAAVGLPVAAAREATEDLPVEIAAINSSKMVTLSGVPEHIDAIVDRLADDHVFVRVLPIQYAFHSAQMEPLKEELLDALANIKPQACQIPFISTVTGELTAGHSLDAGYWFENMRQLVQFEIAVHTLIESGETMFLEIGPHPALQHSIRDGLANQDQHGQVFHSIRRSADESLEILSNLAALYIHNAPIDWRVVNQAGNRFVDLPHYPWKHQHYGYISDARRRLDLEPFEHPLLGARLPATQPTWEIQLNPQIDGYLNDHVLWDSIVFPGAGYGEIGLAVARNLFPDEPYVVHQLQITNALFVSPTNLPLARVVFDEADKSFTIFSALNSQADWQYHAHGQLLKIEVADPDPIEIDALLDSLEHVAGHDEIYSMFENIGLPFGPDFRQINAIWGNAEQYLTKIQPSERIQQQVERYHFHPVLMDACFQTVVAAGLVAIQSEDRQSPFLPMAMERIRLLSEEFPAEFWIWTDIKSQTAGSIMADFQVYHPDGELLAEIRGGRFDRLAQSSQSASVYQIYQHCWEEKRLKSAPISESVGFPPVADMVQAASAVRTEVHQGYDFEQFVHQYLPAVESATQKLIQNALLDIGWGYVPGEVISIDKLVLELGIINRQRPFVQMMLETLVETNILDIANDKSWRVEDHIVSTDIAQGLDALILSFPKLEHEIVILKAIAGNLKDILRGQLDPLRVLFPDGSSHLLNPFYSSGSQAGSYAMLAAALTYAVETLPPDRPLRVLEVGAGTGGLTAAVLPLLPPDRTEYTYTDVGPKFLGDAKQRFANYAFIEYRPLDLSRSLVDQGFDAHSYDIVLAANVIHAIPDITQTLDLIAECLDSNGLFLFIEFTSSLLYVTMIFGLFEEWWHYDEEADKFRLNLKESHQWLDLLKQHGYQNVASYALGSEDTQDILTTLVAVAPECQKEARKNENLETCLIFADQGGICSALSDRLAQAGMRAVFAEGDLEHMLIKETPNVIIHGLLLDHPPAEGLSTMQLIDTQESGVLHALKLVRGLNNANLSQPPRIVFLSRDAQAVSADDRSNTLSAAPLNGFLRVAYNEFSSFPWQYIDLDLEHHDHEIANLVNEILHPDGEYEIAYRGNRRYVNRLRQVKLEDLAFDRQNAVHRDGTVEPYRLEFDQPGELSNLSLHLTRRTAPGPNEVEVHVKAGGINFRDVMKVLGIHPGDSLDLTWLGDDFAGVVVGVGGDVKDLQVGDAVIGICPYAFRSYITVDRRLVFKKPAQLSFEDGATIPTVFATAYYALVRLARLQAGERILIHAATGGVGQAAIQIAKGLELEIYATASTPEKWDFLRAQGVEHIFNSRTLDFADEIMAVTDGKGVDAILNSLAGDFIPRNFSILAPFGRYLEIGKVDVYSNTKIGLQAMRNNVSLHIIDLAGLLIERPDEFASLFTELSEKFQGKTYLPLHHMAFPITEAVEAFRYMAAGKHMGKVVLSFEGDEIPVGRMTEPESLFRPDASYLITGGAGGLGLEVAKWMTKEGARHFVLMSRSGPPDEEATQDIEAMRAAGVNVLDARGDVTRWEDVLRVIDDLRVSTAPLAGVFHLAMVLNDQFLIDLDDDGFNKAFHPKMLGAWNLHLATLGCELDHFVCFSSMSSIIGITKQGNYNAGNAFLDGLANYRRARGLPALTINWGSLSGAGFFERHQELIAYFDKAGFNAIPIEVMLGALRGLLMREGGQVGVASIEWAKVNNIFASVAHSPIFDYLMRPDVAGQTNETLLAQIVSASAEQRLAIVARFLNQKMTEILGTNLDTIEHDVPLTNFGLDSLMAIELINAINHQLNINLAVSDLLSNATILGISELIVSKIVISADGQMGVTDWPIDWASEAVLDSAIFPEDPSSKPTAVQDTILLTGATGFLGAFLLHDLLTQTDATIYCLVRGAMSGLERIKSNLLQYDLWDEGFQERVTTVSGDLEQPLLGLSEDQFTSLAEQIDSIYHLAADINLTHSYQDLKRINVFGVQEVLRLASLGKSKRIHYSSTFAIFFGNEQKKVFVENDRSSPHKLFSGYAQSKWVAEQLIRQAQDRGIACTIYRPGLIIGHSQTGVTNKQDFASRLVKGVYQMGAYPDRSLPMNVVPVDYVSQAIVHLGSIAETAGELFHLTNPQSERVSNLVAWSGDKELLDELPYQEWLAMLTQQAEEGIDNDLIPFLPMFPPAGLEEFTPTIDCAYTLGMLAGSGIVCPAIDRELVEMYRGFLISEDNQAE